MALGCGNGGVISFGHWCGSQRVYSKNIKDWNHYWRSFHGFTARCVCTGKGFKPVKEIMKVNLSSTWKIHLI